MIILKKCWKMPKRKLQNEICCAIGKRKAKVGIQLVKEGHDFYNLEGVTTSSFSTLIVTENGLIVKGGAGRCHCLRYFCRYHQGESNNYGSS